MAPKFNAVTEILEKEIAPLEIGSWTKPEGGYFISFDSLPGCAKRIVALCKDAGVTLTAPAPLILMARILKTKISE